MNRRTFLGATAGALAAADTAKKTVAAIVTAWYPRSHADVICSRILEGYCPNGRTRRSRAPASFPCIRTRWRRAT